MMCGAKISNKGESGGQSHSPLWRTGAHDVPQVEGCQTSAEVEAASKDPANDKSLRFGKSEIITWSFLHME